MVKQQAVNLPIGGSNPSRGAFKDFMITLYIGKLISLFWQNKNHILCIEGKESHITFEVSHSKSIKPYIGGILNLKQMIELKDFLETEIALHDNHGGED